MTKYKKTFFLLFLTAFSLAGYANKSSFPSNNGYSFFDKNENVMDLEVRINSSILFQMQGIPTVGYMDVYSILGVKVTNVNLKSVASIGNCSIDLPKGLYIFRAGKIAKKIIVR